MSKDLRIRNVPDQLHRRVAAAAASRHMSVEEYLLQVLQQMVRLERPKRRSARLSAASWRRAFYEQAARECLATMTEPEARVLQLRFGIGDVEPHSLQAIADDLGISRQRVHQIESTALRKLKHPSRLEVLGVAMRRLQMLERQSRW